VPDVPLEAMILLHLGGTRRKLTIDPTPLVNTPAETTVEVRRANAAVSAASPGVQRAVERFVAGADDGFLLIPYAKTIEAFVNELSACGDAVATLTAALGRALALVPALGLGPSNNAPACRSI
jgi:hypothetical protein